MFTLLINIMQSAIDVIKNTYDYETCKEIVDHGCKSGVCHKHIYYGDTVKFFETYPDEITRYIKDNFGVEVITDNYKENDGDWDAHMNDLTWMFIELVAMEVVDNKEEQDIEDDRLIEEYMKPLNSYNPPNSMNINRYSQV